MIGGNSDSGNGDKCYDLELNTAQLFDWTESKARCDEFGIKLISVLDEDEDEWLNGKIFETGLFNGGDGMVSGMWLGYQGEGYTGWPIWSVKKSF